MLIFWYNLSLLWIAYSTYYGANVMETVIILYCSGNNKKKWSLNVVQYRCNFFSDIQIFSVNVGWTHGHGTWGSGGPAGWQFSTTLSKLFPPLWLPMAFFAITLLSIPQLVSSLRKVQHLTTILLMLRYRDFLALEGQGTHYFKYTHGFSHSSERQTPFQKLAS